MDWRNAQVDYPKALAAEVGKSSIYEAAVDARDARPPADQVIAVSSDNAATKQVAVRCRLAARLIPSSDTLKVDPDDSDWEYRDFSPTGVVQWAWNVTPTKPVDQKLTLVVRPAIDLSGSEGQASNSYGVGSNTEVRVFTDVSVEATLIEKVAHWFETQWPLVLAILVALGAVAVPIWNWYQRRRNRGQGASGGAGA